MECGRGHGIVLTGVWYRLWWGHGRVITRDVVWGWDRLTDTGHLREVQMVAIEAVTGVALADAHTAAVLTAVQDAALLGSQTLEPLVPL